MAPQRILSGKKKKENFPGKKLLIKFFCLTVPPPCNLCFPTSKSYKNFSLPEAPFGKKKPQR